MTPGTTCGLHSLLFFVGVLDQAEICSMSKPRILTLETHRAQQTVMPKCASTDRYPLRHFLVPICNFGVVVLPRSDQAPTHQDKFGCPGQVRGASRRQIVSPRSLEILAGRSGLAERPVAATEWAPSVARDDESARDLFVIIILSISATAAATVATIIIIIIIVIVIITVITINLHEHEHLVHRAVDLWAWAERYRNPQTEHRPGGHC